MYCGVSCSRRATKKFVTNRDTKSCIVQYSVGSHYRGKFGSLGGHSPIAATGVAASGVLRVSGGRWRYLAESEIIRFINVPNHFIFRFFGLRTIVQYDTIRRCENVRNLFFSSMFLDNLKGLISKADLGGVQTKASRCPAPNRFS